MTEETILRSKARKSDAGHCLLDYLSIRFKYQTWDVWRDLILQGKVTVNGSPARPDQLLKLKDLVAYSVVLREPPVDRDIRILHEEETFLVANKPGNLPSHADGNFIKNTFIHILGQTLRQRGFPGELRLAHRLDRETSGLMVVAKTKEAHLKLSRQFEDGSVEKEYLAVARGQVDREKFEVDGPIGRDPESQVSIRRKVVAPGTPDSQQALTLFERMESLRQATLLKCLPRTGRTNQIRVHLDSIGHPIVGDKLYGRTDEEFLDYVHRAKSGDLTGGAKEPGAKRQLLHAHKLVFTHPATGERVAFEAPLPDDMRGYITEHRLPG